MVKYFQKSVSFERNLKMIEIKNLFKLYGTKRAVDNISLTIEKGEVVGFLGPNGAGKTTTMNIITGYISATLGTVIVDGIDISKNPDAVKRKIGYLPEKPPLYLDMTVEEYLNFVYEIKGVKLNRQEHLDEIMQLVKIDDVKKRLIKNLSKGYRQRVGIAQALVGNPEILILDEPTVGLDPKQIKEIRCVIAKLGKDRTVIVSSHILAEIEATCKKVIIINQGKLMAQGTKEELSEKLSSANTLSVRIMGNLPEIKEELLKIDGITDAEPVANAENGAYDFKVTFADGADVRKDMFFALSEAGMPILELKSNKLTLEQIFLKLTSEEAFLAMQKKQEEKREKAIKAMENSTDGKKDNGNKDELSENAENVETIKEEDEKDDRNIKA